MNTKSDIKIAFLAVSALGAEDNFRGAVLVTDGDTYPLEIRYSSETKLTKLEKLAFGLKLKEGAVVSRIAKPLLSSIKASPSLVIVNDQYLLRLQKVFSNLVIGYVENRGGLSADDEGDVKIKFYENKPEYEKAFKALDITVENINFSEPLMRVEKALEYIHAQGTKDL